MEKYQFPKEDEKKEYKVVEGLTVLPYPQAIFFEKRNGQQRVIYATGREETKEVSKNGNCYYFITPYANRPENDKKTFVVKSKLRKQIPLLMTDFYGEFFPFENLGEMPDDLFPTAVFYKDEDGKKMVVQASKVSTLADEDDVYRFITPRFHKDYIDLHKDDIVHIESLPKPEDEFLDDKDDEKKEETINVNDQKRPESDADVEASFKKLVEKYEQGNLDAERKCIDTLDVEMLTKFVECVVNVCQNEDGTSEIEHKVTRAGMTKVDIAKATCQHLHNVAEGNSQITWGEGDTLDREEVAEILLKDHNCVWVGHHPQATFFEKRNGQQRVTCATGRDATKEVGKNKNCYHFLTPHANRPDGMTMQCDTAQQCSRTMMLLHDIVASLCDV
eukprot:jgi/Bigna1/82440/fgenesh1_pg.92_\